MKTQNKKKKTHLVFKLILGAIIGASFGFGVGKMVKSNHIITKNIEQTLNQHCDCESITSNFGAIGIQFSKEDGFSNERLNFTLKNCKSNSSIEEEAVKLSQVLERNVKDFDQIDLLTLHFVSEENSEIIKIRKGEIAPISNDEINKN